MVLPEASWRLYLRKFAAFYAGCLAVCGLHAGLGFTPVLAASLTGTIASILPVSRGRDPAGLRLAAYAGAFFGMGGNAVLSDWSALLLGSVLGAWVYLILRPRFEGLGGRLGLIAFVTSGLLILLQAGRGGR